MSGAGGSYRTLAVTIDDGVATITLDRPDAANAINLELAQELNEATIQVADARCVLIRGAGARFCAGGDLKDFVGRDDLPAQIKRITTNVHAAVANLAGMDAPVIAAVHGAAAGAGLSLACACDIVLAAASTKFVMAFSAVGLVPDGSSTWFIPRLAGLRVALELALTNRTLTADEALAHGLVTRVVADDALTAESEALARTLAAGPTHALGEAKRLIRTSFDHSLETQMKREQDALSAAAGSPEGREGIAAFVEKRKPRFT